MSTTPATISTADFATILSKGTACVLDVRTPAEFAECHVTGAKFAPFDPLDPRKATEALKPADGAPIYLLCKGGTRATKAAEQFIAAGIPLDGQVRIALGAIILASWVLARFVHPAFGWLVLFMAAGLIFSGLTGFSGMAILLGKAPWNHTPSLPDARPRSDRFRCGGRESKFLAVSRIISPPPSPASPAR